MLIIEKNEEMLNVYANAEVFIVPNRATSLDGVSSHTRSALTTDGRMADVETEGRKLIQVWICSDDLGTRNLVDHGAEVELEDGRELQIWNIYGFLPEALFENKVEGDDVEWCYHTKATIAGGTTAINLHLNLKLNQTDYRYSRFGRFEEVYAHVLGCVCA